MEIWVFCLSLSCVCLDAEAGAPPAPFTDPPLSLPLMKDWVLVSVAMLHVYFIPPPVYVVTSLEAKTSQLAAGCALGARLWHVEGSVLFSSLALSVDSWS